MTDHIEEARKTYRKACNYPPETPVADGPFILAIAAALAAADERGRKEERAKTESDQGYIEDENGNKGWIVP